MTVKRCSRCYFNKPVAFFNVRRHNDDGTPRTYVSRCKACMREAQRKDRPRPALTPEERLRRKRTRYAERIAEISADPVALDDWREYIRVKEKLRREKQGAKTYPPRRRWQDGREIAGAYRPPSALETLDPAPFVQFLNAEFPGYSWEEIGAVLQAPARRLRDYAKGQRAELDAIDRALTIGLGRPDILNDLYPVEATA